MRFLVLALLFSVTAKAVTVSNGVGSVTATVSGSQIVVTSSMGSPPSGYFERIWIYTQTLAQAGQGTVQNPAYPYGFTSVPVQRFSDTGGTNSSGSITVSTLGAGSRVYILIAKFSSSNGAHVSSASGAVNFPGMAQTIVGNPTSGETFKTVGWSFTVTGNQTPLTFSRSGIEVGTSANTYIAFLDQVGTHIFHCYAPAGSGYEQSNTVSFSVVVKGYRVTAELPENKTGHLMAYDFRQNGNTVATQYQAKGQAARTVTVEVPDQSPVTIVPRIIGVKDDGSMWTEDQTAETTLTPTMVTPQIYEDPSSTGTSTKVNVTDAPKPNIDKSEKSVWTKSEETDLSAKDKTIKEGTDKIVSKLDEIKKAIQAQGGDYAPGNPNAEAISNAATQGAGATDGQGNGQGSSAAKTATQSAFTAGQGVPTFEPGEPTASQLSITLPGHGTINLDPASDPQASALCDFIKNVISWIALLIYTWWAWGEFKSLCNMLQVSHQAVGNSVIGGTGGQATAVIAAAAITVLISSFPSLYWAYNDIPSMSANPFAGAPGFVSGISLYLLYLVIPVSLILTLIAQAFVLRKFGLVTCMTIATAIRFIVP